MKKKMFVGNLSFNILEKDIKELFEGYGSIDEVELIYDKKTGRFRGFAFVVMEASDADEAISKLNGIRVDERVLCVSEVYEDKDSQEGSGLGLYSMDEDIDDNDDVDPLIWGDDEDTDDEWDMWNDDDELLKEQFIRDIDNC